MTTSRHRSFRPLLVAGAFLLITGVASAVALHAGRADYENLRSAPDATQVHEQLGELETSLASAIRKAEQQVDGRAQWAEIKLDTSPPTIDLLVFSKEAAHRLTINAIDGSVTSAVTLPKEFIPGWPVGGEWTETESGLKYWDIEVGEGKQPTEQQVVTVHYTGYLVDGTKFDSSVDRGQPLQFALSRVIPGWREGVAGMKEGGKRKLVVPYNLAYGPKGQGPIPPRATLIFDVELITVHE